MGMQSTSGQAGVLDQLTRGELGIGADVAAEISARMRARTPLLAARIEQRLREEIRAYANAPSGPLGDTIHAALERAISQIDGTTAPDDQGFAAYERLARDQAADGHPPDALPRAVHLGARELTAALDDEFLRAGIPPSVILQVRDIVWDRTNAITGVIAQVHREFETEQLRHDRVRRAEYLRGVLFGRLGRTRTLARATLFGLSADQEYVAFRARPQGRADGIALLAELVGPAQGGSRGVLADLFDGELVGIAPSAPALDEVRVRVMGVGSPTLLVDLQESFADATEALRTAEAFGLTGTFDLAALGPRPLALAGERSASMLEERYFSALCGGRANREIELTVRTLLELDQNVEAASRLLHVHANTVRYRLGRFRELTGLDIRRTEDFVVAWWLLNRRRTVGAAADGVATS